jgi:hypothetical protein
MAIVGLVEGAYAGGRYVLGRMAGALARSGAEEAAAGAGVRRIPNPGGRHGGAAHRATIDQVASDLEESGASIVAGGGRLPEQAVQVGGGRIRYPDIIAQQADGSMTYVNVGRATKSGAPIARESRALDDLTGTGVDTKFVPYNR